MTSVQVEGIVRRLEVSQRYKIAVAVTLGLLSFGMMVVSIELVKGPTSGIEVLLGILLGTFFPLTLALAWGWRWGVLTALTFATPALMRFWRAEGVGVLYSVLSSTAWVAWHGRWADWRRAHRSSPWYASPFVVEVPFRLVSALGFYAFLRAVPPVFTAYLLLFAALGVLSFESVRRVLGLPSRSASEAELRSLLSAMVEMVFAFDRVGRFTFFHAPKSESLYLPPKEFLGERVEDVMPPEVGALFRQAFEKNCQGEVAVYEYALELQGEVRWFAAKLSPKILNGEFAGSVAVVRDITERRRAERALRESEARYRLLAETAQDLICIHDMEGNITYLNRSALGFTGYSYEEALTHHISDFIPPTQLAAMRARRLRRRAGDAQRYRYEIEFVDAAGARVPVEVSSAPIVRDDGTVDSVLLIARDITERRRAMRQLRESEKLFRTLFENIPGGILIIGEDYVIKDANMRACEITGYTREELVGELCDIVCPKGSASQTCPIWERQQPGFRGMDTTIKRKAGGHVPILKDAKRVQIEGERYILEVFQDVSARKRAAEERERLLARNREQARQLREIMSTVPEGVLLLNAQGRVVEANPVARQDLAFLADAEVGDKLTHIADHPLAEFLTSPTVKGLWHEVEAGVRTFELIARPVESGPEPKRWVLVINDVTQEREVERRVQEQERLAAVGQLAAGIAHDFNNIMAVIVLYTQLGLRVPGLPDELRERLNIIAGQAERATDLIQQILDFGRRAVLERRPMDLVPFLKEQVKLLSRTIPEHIEIDLTYEANAYTVSADPTRMQQVITNLVVNARDAMPKGGRVHLHLDQVRVAEDAPPPLPEMEPGTWVRIAVTDTGVGIPPDVLPRIFEPFFTTKAPLGTGLGLSQVHGIVRQHDGHIDVQTEEGVGTTFELYLPALPVASEATPAPASETLLQGQGERILVVEDDPAMRGALVDTLELLNYRALAASNGREALAILARRREEVALVLSDLVMPGMGGQALFHALRREGHAQPMVMLSGHPMENELQSLQAQGLAGWLLKPPDMARLARLLARALRPEEVG